MFHYTYKTFLKCDYNCYKEISWVNKIPVNVATFPILKIDVVLCWRITTTSNVTTKCFQRNASNYNVQGNLSS